MAYTVARKGNLYIARHGQTTSNVERYFNLDEEELNEQGWKDAHQLAHGFRDVPLDKVVTSDRLRAIQTSEPLVKMRSLEHKIISDLREHDNGSLTGKPYPEGMDGPAAQHFLLRADTIFGGESNAATYERAVRVREQFKEYHDEDILMITHSTFGIFLSLALDDRDFRDSNFVQKTGMYDLSHLLKNVQHWHYQVTPDKKFGRIERQQTV